MASSLVSPPVVKTKALFCPNCGGPVELRGFGHALTVVCPQCLSVLDATTPLLQKLQQIEEAQRRNPKIPLGSRGKLGGGEWEVIGYQTRQTQGEETFSWDEYLLFNPYSGFRYLTEFQGHWNVVSPLESLPVRLAIGRRPAVSYLNRTYRHFSGAVAATVFVIGEFPWRIKVGETVVCDDFINPPTMLSSETTDDEVTWSQGEYTPGAEIWKAFGLPGDPPRAQGIFANQPAPATTQGSGIWRVFALFMLLLIGLAMFFATFSRQKLVFSDHYHYTAGQPGDASFVTKDFELEGRASTLQLAVNTDINDDWVYFNFGLINEDTGTAFDFGREVSYYSGSDSDGTWTEGSRNTTDMIPSVPPGKYYLWVDPEMDTTGSHHVDYAIELRHDVPSYSWFWLTALLLLIPPVVHTMRRGSFETLRWRESDYS